MANGGTIVWDLNVESSQFTAGLNKASAQAKDFGSKVESSLDDSTKRAAQKVKDNFLQIAAALAGLGVAFNKLSNFMEDSVGAANRQQAAFIGLNSVAKAFGQDADDATDAARRLAQDGLMSVGEAAKGLKNLLASGFSLPQAVKLMERFKDSAAFGRQSALTFGEAVASATEGIKNGNSILVDNAGVTKNLSVILKEAGFGADDLMNATTDANVRLALFNGILKETNPQLGDAAKFANTAAGKQAKFAQQTEILKAKIGESLQPALIALIKALTPMIEAFAKFTTDHPGVVSAVLIIGAVLTGLLFTLGAVGLAVTGLSPIFAAFGIAGSAAAGAVAASFKGMAALVATPLVMPALVIAAALASIWTVFNAVNAVRGAVEALESKAKSAADEAESSRQVFNRLFELQKTGNIDQRLRAAEALRGQGMAGFASGTNFAPGGLALVGERGPELVNLPRGSQVIPNDKTESMLSGQKNEYHIGTINIASEVDGEKWLKKLTRNQEIFDNGLVPSRTAM